MPKVKSRSNADSIAASTRTARFHRVRCPCEDCESLGGRLQDAQTIRRHMERQSLKQARLRREQQEYNDRDAAISEVRDGRPWVSRNLLPLLIESQSAVTSMSAHTSLSNKGSRRLELAEGQFPCLEIAEAQSPCLEVAEDRISRPRMGDIMIADSLESPVPEDPDDEDEDWHFALNNFDEPLSDDSALDPEVLESRYLLSHATSPPLTESDDDSNDNVQAGTGDNQLYGDQSEDPEDVVDPSDPDDLPPAFYEDPLIRNIYIRVYIEASFNHATHESIKSQLLGHQSTLRHLMRRENLQIRGLDKMALTLRTVEHRLGVYVDQYIRYYFLCPVCWHLYDFSALNDLETSQCLQESCTGIIFMTKQLARGMSKRIPIKVLPTCPLIPQLQRILKRPGKLQDLQHWRGDRASANHDCVF